MPFGRAGPQIQPQQQQQPKDAGRGGGSGGSGSDGGGDNQQQQQQRPKRSSSSSRGRGRSGDRSKGITMEDLKKQTALRLAKEHRATGGGGNRGGGSGSGSNHHRMESPSPHQQMHPSGNVPVAPRQHQGGGPAGPIPQSNNTTIHHPPYVGYSQEQQPQLLHPHQPIGYYNPPHIGVSVPYYPSPSGEPLYPPHLPQNSGPPPGGIYTSGPPASQMMTAQSSQFSHIEQQQHVHPPSSSSYEQRHSPPLQYQGQYPGNWPSSQGQPPSSGYVSAPSQLAVATASGLQPLGSAQSNQADFSSNTKGGGRNVNSSVKNKLPHGLTVHELKEMTKARLQAEAADGPEDGPAGLAAASMSSTSSRTDRSLMRTSPHPPSSMTNTSTGVVVGRQTQPSPLTAAGAPSFRPVTHRSDTWESASVASYNSLAGISDNLGTESVVSDVGSHAGNRTRSFTYPAVQTPDHEHLDDVFNPNLNLSREAYSNPPSAQASPSRPGLGGLSYGQSSFDAAVGGNRRRAVTLSPNAGSIQEDRPHHFGSTIGRETLIIPSFSSTASGSGPIMPTRQQRGYSPVLGQLGSSVLEDSFSGSQNTGPVGSVGGDVLSDGFRRSGAPSQVGVSTPERHSLNDLPTTRASGSALREKSSDDTRVSAPPPGFDGSDSLFQSGTSRTAFSKVRSVESIPDGFHADRTGYWDPDIEVSRPHFASVDNLASDMGSLLNLSGASTPERPDRGRANTYTFGASSNSGPSGSFFASLPDDDFVGGSSSQSKKDPFRHL